MKIFILCFYFAFAKAQLTTTVWQGFGRFDQLATTTTTPALPGPITISSTTTTSSTASTPVIRWVNFTLPPTSTLTSNGFSTTPRWINHSNNLRNFTHHPVSNGSKSTWPPSKWNATRRHSTTPRASTSKTTWPKPVEPRGQVITGVTFSNYEQVCPHNLPVRAFTHNVVDNGTVKDYSLKALCLLKVTFENGSALNLSTAECDYREAFSIDYDEVSENDTKYMCGQGEYVNGVQSKFWQGTRLIRIHCCKSPLLQYSTDYGCQAYRSDQTNILLQSKRSSKCPIEVLTGVRIMEPRIGDDTLIRYCGLAPVDMKYSAVCDMERKAEQDRIQKTSTVGPIPFFDSPTNQKRYIQPGDESEANSDFTVKCLDYEAIDSVDVEKVGEDFAFRVTCKSVAPRNENPIRKTLSDFRTLTQLVQEDNSCNYNDDYALCGIDSYIGEADLDGSQERYFSFMCCEMINAKIFVKSGLQLNTTQFDKRGRVSVSKAGYFLEKMHIVYKKNSKQTPVLVTGWSAYNVTKVDLFPRRFGITSNTNANVMPIFGMIIGFAILSGLSFAKYY